MTTLSIIFLSISVFLLCLRINTLSKWIKLISRIEDVNTKDICDLRDQIRDVKYKVMELKK